MKILISDAFDPGLADKLARFGEVECKRLPADEQADCRGYVRALVVTGDESVCRSVLDGDGEDGGDDEDEPEPAAPPY